jgi:hypothetical protein
VFVVGHEQIHRYDTDTYDYIDFLKFLPVSMVSVLVSCAVFVSGVCVCVNILLFMV